MTLTFLNAYNSDRSEQAKRFYIAVTKQANVLPVNSHYNKERFLEKIWDNDKLFFIAEAVNFQSISRNNIGITIKF